MEFMLELLTEKWLDKIRSVREHIINEQCLLTLDAVLFICLLLKENILTLVSV
jgi:hypothetical protein